MVGVAFSPVPADGTNCRAAPGEFVPVVDPARCESKGPCIGACPFGVLGLVALTDSEVRALPLGGRLRTWVHGREKARAVDPDACRACGLCVSACPEKAIRLRRASAKPPGLNPGRRPSGSGGDAAPARAAGNIQA